MSWPVPGVWFQVHCFNVLSKDHQNALSPGCWASAYGGGAVNTPEGRNSEGLGRLQEWANQNLMIFNSGTTNGPVSDISWGWPIQQMAPWWWLGNPGGQQAEQGQAVYLDSNKGPAVPWLCKWRNGLGLWVVIIPALVSTYQTTSKFCSHFGAT